MRTIILLHYFLIGLCFCETLYKTVYVSTHGSDIIGDGSRDNPFRTVMGALLRHQEQNMEIFLMPGDHILQSEIIFNQKSKLIISGESPDTKPIILDFGIRVSTARGFYMEEVTLRNLRFESHLALRVVRASVRQLTIEGCDFLMSGATATEIIRFEQTRFIPSVSQGSILFKDCVFDTRESYTFGYNFFFWKITSSSEQLNTPLIFQNSIFRGSEYGPIEIYLERIQELKIENCTFENAAFINLKDAVNVDIRLSNFNNSALLFQGSTENARILYNTFNGSLELDDMKKSAINICPHTGSQLSIHQNTFKNFNFPLNETLYDGGIRIFDCLNTTSTNTSIDISWNDFSEMGENQTAIINELDDINLDATKNYYGPSKQGPIHCCNPKGTNIKVVGDKIEYHPWCCDPPVEGQCGKTGETCGDEYDESCPQCNPTMRDSQIVVIIVSTMIIIVVLIVGMTVIYCCSRGKAPVEYNLIPTDSWRSKLLSNVENVQELFDKFGIKLIDYYELKIENIPIGCGSFGEVFKGEWKNKLIAIKRISNLYTDQYEELEQFLEEIKIMGSIDHPNILKLKGISIEPETETLNLITDLMENGSLDDLLFRKQEKLDLEIKLSIATDIAYGMHYLHSKDPGIVHRDLKPGNVLINRKYNAKVADFGIAKVLEHKAATMTIKGTPVYLAPECILRGKFSEKSDVYAYGITLTELYTEQRAYEDVEGAYTYLMMRIATEGLRPTVTKCSEEIKEIIYDCVQENPEDRPSFTQILEKLSEIRLNNSLKLKK